jgi:DNA-binding protein, histone-like, putative
MAISYIVRRKKNTLARESKELWYPVAKTVQPRGGITNKDIAARVSQRTGLAPGVVEGVLTEAAEAIEFFLSYGFTVNLNNLGSFQTSLTGKGCEHPAEVTPGQVELSRICFIANRNMTKRIRENGYIQIPLKDYLPEKYWKDKEEE